MATIIKDMQNPKTPVPKYYTRCDVQNESGYNCSNCKKTKLTDPMCDLKCLLPNHIMNTSEPGLVCKDFVERDEQWEALKRAHSCHY